MKIAGFLVLYLFSAFANADKTYLVNQTNNTINLEYLLCTYTRIYENNIPNANEFSVSTRQ